MKLAVIADIHSNWPALEAVAEHVEQWQPDRVVVAGDTVNRGPRPLECLNFVLDKQKNEAWLQVLGNHEEYVMSHAQPDQQISGPLAEVHGVSYWTYLRLNRDVSALAVLPFQQSWQMPDGATARIVHASMRGTRDGIYTYTPDAVLRQQIVPGPALLVVGHTHKPLIREIDETLVVNAGSVGLPFDGDHRASYAQLTWNAGWHAEIVRVEYDRAQADRDFDETGFIDQAGPIAKLVRDELRRARSNLFEWTRDYEARVLSGQLSVAESVERFLAS